MLKKILLYLSSFFGIYLNLVLLLLRLVYGEKILTYIMGINFIIAQFIMIIYYLVFKEIYFARNFHSGKEAKQIAISEFVVALLFILFLILALNYNLFSYDISNIDLI